MAKKKKQKKAKRGQKKAGAKRPGRKARAPAAQHSVDKGDLEGVLNGLRSTYGEGSIQLLKGDWAAPVDVLPTGHKGFDHDLMGNLGGLPRGRMIEVFGAESAGKTTVALYWVAAAQRAGGTVVFIDAEHALDPEYAAKLGVDTEKLLLAQPDSGEQALDITRQLIESGQIAMIVIDSVAALVPQKELEGEIGDAHVGLQARMLSQACRMLSAQISQTNTILVWINQIREKVGVMFGNPEVTPGGRAIKFYSSVRVEVRHGATVKNAQEKIVGKVAHLKAVKNKVAPPFGTTDFVLMFDQEKNRWGVDIFKAAYAYALERGILVQNGSWIATSWGLNRFQGEEKFRAAIEADEELRRQFYQMVESESPALPAAVEVVPTETEPSEVS